MDRLDQMLTDIRFYEQVLLDARRTIFCPPDLAAAVQAVVEQYDAANLFTVRASTACPEHRLLLIDEQALEADFRASLLRRPTFGSCRSRTRGSRTRSTRQLAEPRSSSFLPATR